MSALSALPFLDPQSMGAGDDESQSPMRKMLGVMALKSLTDSAQSDESGGEVGKRAIDQGTTSPSNPVTGNAQGDDAHRMTEAMTSGDMTPPGFDRLTGMPTEFPATATKASARDTLQKKQAILDTTRAQENKPSSMVKHALLGMIPIAGPLLTASRLGNERRQRADVGQANEQYQFEAGEEERQREAATRERVAMTGLEYTRAAKNLMAEIANKRADITQNVGQGRNIVAGAKGGYDVNIGPKGEETVTPKAKGDLSEVQRQSLSVQQATTELKKAQTAAIPEQIEIAKKKVEVETQKLEAYLQNLDFSQSMRREEQDFRESGPTTQTRNAGQLATGILPRMDELAQEIRDFKPHLGALKSRWSDVWAGKVGLSGPELTQFKKIQDDTEFLHTNVSLAHARGRMPLPIFNEFSKMYDLGKQDPDNMLAAIEIGKKWMSGLQKNAQWDEKLAIPRSMQAAPQGAASKLQRRSAGTAAPPANTVNVVRGPNGKLVIQRPPTSAAQ